jgi:hypothetical protein
MKKRTSPPAIWRTKFKSAPPAVPPVIKLKQEITEGEYYTQHVFNEYSSRKFIFGSKGIDS